MESRFGCTPRILELSTIMEAQIGIGSNTEFGAVIKVRSRCPPYTARSPEHTPLLHSIERLAAQSKLLIKIKQTKSRRTDFHWMRISLFEFRYVRIGMLDVYTIDYPWAWRAAPSHALFISNFLELRLPDMSWILIFVLWSTKRFQIKYILKMRVIRI